MPMPWDPVLNVAHIVSEQKAELQAMVPGVRRVVNIGWCSLCLVGDNFVVADHATALRVPFVPPLASNRVKKHTEGVKYALQVDHFGR